MTTIDAKCGLLAVAVLATCLALFEAPPFSLVFDGIAMLLAVLADPLLSVLGAPVVRLGSELRALDGSWAVLVSDVCDGHGLVAAWIAVVVATASDRRTAIAAAVSGALALQVFNLVRVIALALALARSPQAFETWHLEVFPQLSAAAMIGLAAGLLKLGARRTATVLAVLVLAALAWSGLSGAIADRALLPPANAINTLFGPEAVRGISETAVATTLLASIDPGFYSLPIHPADFAIALPVLLAVAVVNPHGWLFVLVAILAMPVALALGAATAHWVQVEAVAPVSYIFQGSDGNELRTAQVPGAAWLFFQRLAQNVIVHANLLVIPSLVLAAHRWKARDIAG